MYIYLYIYMYIYFIYIYSFSDLQNALQELLTSYSSHKGP